MRKAPNDKTEKTKNYDLEDRTLAYSRDIIELCKKMPQSVITKPLISQLVRSATSIGANYCEADCAGSKKDFIHKLTLCKKEAKEARYWLKLIYELIPEYKNMVKPLIKEANELILIFSSTINKTKSNSLNKKL